MHTDTTVTTEWLWLVNEWGEGTPWSREATERQRTAAELQSLLKRRVAYSWQDFKRYYRAEAEKEWAEAREAEEVQPAENMSGDESSEGSAGGGADAALSLIHI